MFAAPAIRSPIDQIDILMVTTMALVWTVNSTLSWGVITQYNGNYFARSGQISEFHILPLQMPPPPAQCRPGADASLSALEVLYVIALYKSTFTYLLTYLLRPLLICPPLFPPPLQGRGRDEAMFFWNGNTV